MGQGQADVALQLLRDCSINGDWLCLKNLHLVTSTVIRNTMHLHLPSLYNVHMNSSKHQCSE